MMKSVGRIRRSFAFGERAKRQQDLGEQGFTLVEMLVVITIIGLIMGLIGPRVLNYLGESKVKTAKIQLQSFSSALDLFFLDAGRYPSSSEGLAALMQRTSGVGAWNGPYLKGNSLPNDPWNHPYVYRAPGEHGPRQVAGYLVVGVMSHTVPTVAALLATAVP